MKNLALFALAALFCLCRIVPLQKNKVVLLRRFPQWGSLGALGDALDKCPGLRIVRIENWRRLSTVYHLATAGVIFLNDGFRPLAYFPFSRQAQIIQLWHADGALKRWGCSVGDDFPEAKRWTAAICGHESMRAAWAEAFGMPVECVLPLGSPWIDALTAPRDVQALRDTFDTKHPQCKGRRLILYAPSFRDNDSHSEVVLSRFDFAKFKQRFGDEIALLVRLHPKLHGQYTLPDWVVDVTLESDLATLLQISERLVTDYSSMMTDGAALGLPVILYAWDYDEYMTHDRGFYGDLRTLPPGPIVTDFDALLDLLEKPDNSAQLREAYVRFHLGEPDGNSCERIIRAVFGK